MQMDTNSALKKEVQTKNLTHIVQKIIRDEDPVVAKNRIQGSVPQTKGDF